MTHSALPVLALAALVLSHVCEAGSPLNAAKLSGEMLRNTFSVFTLIDARERSLDAIISELPDLRQDAAIARIEFNNALDPAINAVDEFLTRNSTPEFDWPTVKREQLTAALGRLEFSGISHQQAMNYVPTVRNRAKGDIPQWIHNVLVAFDPVYQKYPHMEKEGRRPHIENLFELMATGLDFLDKYGFSRQPSQPTSSPQRTYLAAHEPMETCRS